MFVSSMHIYHVKPSLDPIFPAQQIHYFPDQREPSYYNEIRQARVLVCADKTELCSPNGEICWNMTAQVPKGVPSTPAYWLMRLSLENSDTYSSIQWRLGSALLAQEKVSQFRSRPLDPHQWQLEAKQLFATSLARIQYDARKIAIGENSELTNYKKATPDEAGNLCGLYKFKTPEYSNINLTAFIGLLVLAFAIFVLSLNARAFGYRVKRDKDGEFSANEDEPFIHDDQSSADDDEASIHDDDGSSTSDSELSAQVGKSSDEVSGPSSRGKQTAPRGNGQPTQDIRSKVQRRRSLDSKDTDPLVIDVIVRGLRILLIETINASIWLWTFNWQEKKAFASAFANWVKAIGGKAAMTIRDWTGWLKAWRRYKVIWTANSSSHA